MNQNKPDNTVGRVLRSLLKKARRTFATVPSFNAAAFDKPHIRLQWRPCLC